MAKPLFVFEDIKSTPHRKMFSLLGTEILATPKAWLSIPSYIVPGFLIGLATGAGPAGNVFPSSAVIVGILLFVTNPLHSLGHILAGKIVGAKLEAVLITATRNVNVHISDQSRYSRSAILIRSFGGPILNILSGLASFGVWKWTRSDLAFDFFFFNVAIGIWTLFPVPSFDGWTIWKALAVHTKGP